MVRTLFASALALVLAVPAVALACGDGKAKSVQAQAWQPVSVEVLAEMKAQETPMAILDANGQGTRTKMGVIPGATLLTSSSQYELSELPEAKKTPLVFYCANTHCTASKTAAERAAEAGYEQVFVLPAGIKGWVEAGQPVDRPDDARS